MDREALVYVELNGRSHLMGHLWARASRGRESASFEYDPAWLAHPERFALEPALTLSEGPHHTGKALFGALGDSAPDRWGRNLMRRVERRRAKRENRQPRTLSEMDFLLMVDDELRQGAIRFKEVADGPFLANDGSRIPPLVRLPRLLAATERVIEDGESDEDLRLLLAPGSSLGGARPKAAILDADGHLATAKFPHKDDDQSGYRVNLWEAIALALAGASGIPVPESRVENVAGKDVLIIARFDRFGERRVPFLSAMSMLGASDGEDHSYLEIADALRAHGAATARDLHDLWRRIAFNVLISNVDDHLRNHGFLHAGADGWRLSPAYDLNPVPTDIRPRELSTAIDFENTAASLDLAFEVAAYFDLSAAEAKRIAHEVASAVSCWRDVAGRLGAKPSEIDRMATAFEHEDLELALGRTSVRPGVR